MVKVQHRIRFISIFVLLALIIFFSSDRPAYGELLYIGKTQKTQDGSTATDDLLSAKDISGEEYFEGEEKDVKGKNPVALFFKASKEKLRDLSVAKDTAFNEITSAASSNINHWPLALVALLLVMLMMRYKRRMKKSKF